jgi:hypothetical protein
LEDAPVLKYAWLSEGRLLELDTLLEPLLVELELRVELCAASHVVVGEQVAPALRVVPGGLPRFRGLVHGEYYFELTASY